MNTNALAFTRPADLFAGAPPEAEGRRRDDVRLLVTDDAGHRHARFRDLPRFLEAGDLLVVNESAAMPASLEVESRLGPLILNLCTRFRGDLWLAEPRWGPSGPGPLPLETADVLESKAGRITLVAPYPGIPRLWFVHADRPLDDTLARIGRPIHYGYTAEWPMETYWTEFSRVPGSSEMPSAARPITREIRESLENAGVLFAPIVLHTGVSSLEIETSEVEGQAVYPEPFEVSRASAELVNATRANGGRVLAVGTSVVRALESAVSAGVVHPAQGYSRRFVHPRNGLSVVDGLLTGFHDPVTSHLAMLAAFIGIDRVHEAYRAAVDGGYRWHEFGDSHLILRGQSQEPPAPRPVRSSASSLTGTGPN